MGVAVSALVLQWSWLVSFSAQQPEVASMTAKWTCSSQGDWCQPNWIFRALPGVMDLVRVCWCCLIFGFGFRLVCWVLRWTWMRGVVGWWFRSLLGLMTVMDFGLPFRGQEGLGQSNFGRTRGSGVSVSRSRWWVLKVVVVVFLRFGEASHPGPMSNALWSLGIGNPSGLNGKVDQEAALEGDVWVFSETHLSRHGFSRFKQGMKALATPWQYAVAGAPCPTRGGSETGTHAGVLMLSRFPARAIPQSFDPDLYTMARMQVAGVSVQGVWVTVGMLYGLPCNASHKQAKFQTDSMLAELVDRVAVQSVGPRAVAGDFNYASAELSQIQRLEALGFREVQDLAAWRWGMDVVSTGRGRKRIDQLWISPELQRALQHVEVCWDHWADHASVVASFSALGADLTYDAWRLPTSFPWPEQWDGDFFWQVDQTPTEAYACLWRTLELRAAAHTALQGRSVPRKCWGRAQTLTTQVCRYQWSPGRKARYGEVQQGFFGVSLQHARFFRQLRRLQALSQQLQLESLSWTAKLNRDDTWRAIRRAHGFQVGFGLWWQAQKLAPSFPGGLPLVCPAADVVRLMFDSFHQWVKAYESSLAQARYQQGKKRRENSLNFVFRDCRAERPPQVDTLITRVEVGVEEVRAEDCSLVLRAPARLLPDLPVVVGGKVVKVLHHEADQIWVEDVTGVEEGMSVSQEKAMQSDRDILAQFQAVWQPRWNKLEHVAEGQWTQICDFVQAHFRPIQWNFAPWSAERVGVAVAKKKKHAAVGPDGVSQPDLAALPFTGRKAFADMYAHIEAGSDWPCQLATGFVSSLAKQPDAQSVDEFRPVTVYGLPYRIWSSERAKEALRCINLVVPESVQGGLPARQAKAIWYSVAQALEDAYLNNTQLHGLLMDIRKCFNAIPRLPLWQALTCLGFPVSVLRAWVRFVSGQVRRFKVRHSVGEPVSSVCGLPEGCALSVFGIVVVDWMLDVWLARLSNPPLLQAFVDDWAVIYREGSALARIWTSLQQFTEQMDLTIDLAKTRVWSTDAVTRAQYRAETLELEVSHVARNLGAHQNFSRHCWNSVLQRRLSLMPGVWTKLRASLSPYSHKHVALRMLGWPKAFHGCSVVHIGVDHYKKVRSGAMRGLRAERKGANPVCICPSTTSWVTRKLG